MGPPTRDTAAPPGDATGTIFPYDPPVDHGHGLLTVDGTWHRSPLKRRMTLIRRGDGALAVHSAIRMRDDDWGAIERLGRVDLVLVPSTLHADEARHYAERWRDCRVLVPAAARERLAAKLPRIDATYADGLPRPWRAVLDAAPLAGTRMHETLFLHRPSRSLIATDFVFHYASGDLRGLPALAMRLNGVVGRVAPSRVFRWLFLTDLAALRRSLAPVAAWDFDRVVMAHGRIVETGGKAAFEAGLRARFGPGYKHSR